MKKRLCKTIAYFTALVAVCFALSVIIISPIIGILLLITAFSLTGIDYKTVYIRYKVLGVKRAEKIHVGDWIDLRAAERVELKKGEYALIPLGVAMKLPKGYEAHVLPRSSTPSKFGIICANSMGVIDNSYCGDEDEWKFPALAIRDTVIEKNDRICQFRIVENQPEIRFQTVLRLGNKSRGGIGSTGTR